ncbi:SDR family oxidoreductase [Kitasatospora kifunensis]|uniref:NAD(P)-dependent dehydrogenase (Short-subunit alcohol dehydrogenase family) n=1 Tax=Kitasatospora kifunensis TaxID=58351 RepID=A0A7W7R790_KITKI|nr:SDR family oxidoreductase [Kitasatospora kifunensis]MBB4926732.1 NAD(P)-dependent dehydrogenase (short-subunit alcohol dehydrogenase family) [Kitasatospora kifunensis]
MSFTGQRVVVLGGTSGIGLATAALVARDGAEVVVVSSSQEKVAKALSSLPAGAGGEVADLREPSQVAALFERVGSFDHLAYTAGEPLPLTRMDALDLRQAQDFFAVRYFGALSAVSAAMPFLRPGGSVTLTSGTAGHRPVPGWALAASVCGAVEALVRALALELAPIRVNAVTAGVVRSPLWSDMDEGAREQWYEQTAATLPLGRIAEVEDVAEAYAYLMRQRHATGTVVMVEGGTLLV